MVKKDLRSNPRLSIIIAASGDSVRLQQGISKQFVLLNEKPILFYSLEKFALLKNIEQIIIVTNDISRTEEFLKKHKSTNKIEIVSGRSLRQDSVYSGFCAVDPSVDLVIIHDVARPLFEIDDMKKCLTIALDKGAAVLASKVTDTIKKSVDNNLIVEKTLNRDNLYCIQTPQIFAYDLLDEAYKLYRSFKEPKPLFTDEASLIEFLGKPVYLVLGSRTNIKITYPEDLRLANAILEASGQELEASYV